MKGFKPWLLRILGFSSVESVTCPRFGLREGSFGLQPITHLVDGETYMGFHMASMDDIGRACR